MPKPENTGPLAGVKIVDLTSVVMGPFASQIMADLGADVVKIESFEGDVLRRIGPSRSNGMGPLFLALNRNKRSLSLDLRRPEAQEILRKLLRNADVFLSNLRPASIERLGLGYEALAAINPRIVYCAGYGFGEGGRYAGKPAFDDLIQGGVSLPSLLGRIIGEPRYLPTNLCDRVTGLTMVYAITSALYARERSGRGQAVEVPMFETMTQFVLSDHMYGMSFDPPLGQAGYPRLVSQSRHPYRTRDGHICVVIYLEAHWVNFCKLIGREDMLADPRFDTMQNRSHNIDALLEFLRESMLTRTTAEWLEQLGKADIPSMPLHTPETLFDDPHLADIGFFKWIDHPSEGKIRSMGIPMQWSESQLSIRHHAPLVGENTDEILTDVGYTQAEIDAMLAAGIVKSSKQTKDAGEG
ncbi:CaiB/BaiF CoA-transferase family protein [Acidocella sp.]|uniref:CaiB/BaiF CoA transferase family protein n=1 Tax=Acidocella sp. TaxID=50710 RepID=UPI00262643D9|nr:CoA transferase [Acidocella sp.]